MADIDRAEAEDFLYQEARLIDERRFDDWLGLFAEDAHYWLPIRDDAGPREHLSLIYDDRQRMRERVFRLGLDPLAQSPPSRTLHLVSNVQIRPGDGGDEVVLHSAQVVHEMRTGDDRQLGLGDARSFAARCEHHLRRDNGAWKITLKRMLLLNRDTAISNLTFII